MGNVSSRAEEGTSIYLRDQARFAIAGILVTNSRTRTLLQISPTEFPATRYSARREAGNDAPVDYIQDPESLAHGSPTFLLKLSNEDELIFSFTFSLRRDADTIPPASAQNPVPDTADTVVNGLTFMFAPSLKELDSLITKELHADPNMHKNNPNIHLIGDYTTAGTPYTQAQWTWKWRPPKQPEDFGGGWRTCCSFVEYDQRTHKLSALARFVIWVQNSPQASTSPKSPSPRLDVGVPIRLRVPSSQSIESRVSDSDTDTPAPIKDVQPASPIIEAIPEDGLGFVPSQSVTTTSTLVPAKADILCQRPGDDVSAVDDGPLFRATMKAMEQKTGNMRARWKKVLKRAEAAVEAEKAKNNAVIDLVEALREASLSNASAVQPAMEIYFDKIARDIIRNDKQDVVNLEKMIINPISRLYNNDIKAVEAKKRDFDEESKDYYAFLSRYLGQRSDSMKDKKRQDTDKKYQDRRRNFELRRFDYSSFMQDLHGGRKDQEVLSHLTRYADAQARGYLATAKKIEETLPLLDALTNDVNQANRDFQIHRTEREEKRRAIEKSVSGQNEPETAAMPSLQHTTSVAGSSARPIPEAELPRPNTSTAITTTNLPPPNGVPIPIPGGSYSTNSIPQTSSLGTSPGSSRFKGYRDLEDKGIYTAGENLSLRKEGLVWALSRPGSHVDPKGLNKQAWHKFWIVLDGGKLSEYTNWKQKLDLHMDPIDLRVASVREARNAERRFCFEIITPQFTRVYQATNEDDMKAWIGTINNALQSAVEGKGLSGPRLSDSPSPGSIRKDIASVLTGKSASTGHRSGYSSTPPKIPGRHATVGDRPAHRPVETSESSRRLLQQIREADAGNNFCADCGSDQKVDWVSINLGIVICIECSGIHRSLGTHISKVRSLTLDPNAFTVDVIEILIKIGNRVANMVWEANLDRALKPTAQSNREQRLQFITAKYAERLYVQGLSPTLSAFSSPDETLLASIKKNDIQNVNYALALRANPNTLDRSRSTHAVFLALAAADPAAPSPVPSPRPSTSTRPPSLLEAAVITSHPLRKPFPIAELLLLNGSDLPTMPAPIPLSTSARTYLDAKAEQKSGRKAHGAGITLVDDGGIGVGADTLTALPDIRAGNGTTPRERERERERLESERLRKRVSSSGRLTKPSPNFGAGYPMDGRNF